MKETATEPDLLQTFRVLTGFRLCLTLLGGFILVLVPLIKFNVESTDRGEWFLGLITIVDAVVLLVYLSWPWFEQKMGKCYLPVAILIASLGPILETNLLNFGLVPTTLARNPEMAAAWQLVLILFIPLLIVAWQYDYSRVVLFAIGTAALDLLLISISLDINSDLFIPFLGVTFIRTSVFLLVGYMITRLMRSQRNQRNALAEANEELVLYSSTLEQLAITRERNRLARELHDTLAHTLSAVAVQLEAVRSVWDEDTAKARALINQALRNTRAGLTETRRSLRALRATPLEDLGLLGALRDLTESMVARADFNLCLDLPPRLEKIPPAVEQCIYRIAQESLSNINAHAQAKEVKVTLTRGEHRVTLIIEDNGLGFNPENIEDESRFGIQGMKEHAETIGGILEIDSSPDRGTIIHFYIEDMP